MSDYVFGDTLSQINHYLLVWVTEYEYEAFALNEEEVVIKNPDGYSRAFDAEELLTRLKETGSSSEVRNILCT